MDGTRSIWDVMAARAAVGIVEVPAGGHPDRPEGAAGPAGSSAYLAIPGKDCDREEEKKIFEVAACGCRSWFCPRCCIGRGLALRERLIPILQRFQSLLMWTFTIDPLLFDSPREAYLYVKSKRCISNVMRRLREAGYLHSDRYFCVIEWQKSTEMPHFHILADSSFIPFDEVCQLWNRFRPEEAGPVQGARPGFGSIRFSAPRFRTAQHAARYACKYLIKHPEYGYPDWVLDFVGEVHRYSTSRGFWATDADLVEPRPGDTLPPDCPGDCAGNDADDSEADSLDSAIDRHFEVKSIRDRLANCGRTCVVLQLMETVDQVTGEVIVHRRFVSALYMNIAEAAELVGHRLPEGKRRFVLDSSAIAKLVRCDRKKRQDVVQ